MTLTSASIKDSTRRSANATKSRLFQRWPEDPAEVPDDPLSRLPGSAVVAVAMSGGVDSSVAAARVVAAGVRSFAITLAMWPADRAVERDRGCCSIDAVEDARRVATA